MSHPAYAERLGEYVYIKIFCMCKWAYLVFPSIYSVLVYHRYTNANIGPLWIRTLLNMFLTPKQPKSEIRKWLLFF